MKEDVESVTKGESRKAEFDQCDRILEATEEQKEQNLCENAVEHMLQ